MNVLAWILGVVLVVAFAIGGVTKVIDMDRMRDHFGYSKGQYQLIGLSEIAAAAGILIGLLVRKVEWIGGAAGIGICCLMIGAMLTHARVEDDAKKAAPAIVMFVLAIVFMIALTLR